jgi:hypothetical protein
MGSTSFITPNIYLRQAVITSHANMTMEVHGNENIVYLGSTYMSGRNII